MVISNSSDGRGTVSTGPGGVGTRVVEERWPVEEGLTAGTTKQVGNPNLIEQGLN